MLLKKIIFFIMYCRYDIGFFWVYNLVRILSILAQVYRWKSKHHLPWCWYAYLIIYIPVFNWCVKLLCSSFCFYLLIIAFITHSFLLNYLFGIIYLLTKKYLSFICVLRSFLVFYPTRWSLRCQHVQKWKYNWSYTWKWKYTWSVSHKTKKWDCLISAEFYDCE